MRAIRKSPSSPAVGEVSSLVNRHRGREGAEEPSAASSPARAKWGSRNEAVPERAEGCEARPRPSPPAEGGRRTPGREAGSGAAPEKNAKPSLQEYLTGRPRPSPGPLSGGGDVMKRRLCLRRPRRPRRAVMTSLCLPRPSVPFPSALTEPLARVVGGLGASRWALFSRFALGPNP